VGNKEPFWNSLYTFINYFHNLCMSYISPFYYLISFIFKIWFLNLLNYYHLLKDKLFNDYWKDGGGGVFSIICGSVCWLLSVVNFQSAYLICYWFWVDFVYFVYIVRILGKWECLIFDYAHKYDCTPIITKNTHIHAHTFNAQFQANHF